MIKLLIKITVLLSFYGCQRGAIHASKTKSSDVSVEKKVFELTQDEISTGLALLNRLNVQPTASGPCLTSEVTIEESSCGFTPSEWGATFNVKDTENKLVQTSSPLTESESGALARLFSRVNVPVASNSACDVSRAKLVAQSCGFTPDQWTIEY